MSSGGGFAGFNFFEDPDDGDTAEAEESEPSEDVDEGPVEGLLAELEVELSAGCGEGVGGTVVAGDGSPRSGDGVLKGLAGLGDGVDDVVLVGVGAAGEESFGDGDADRSADVTHEVEEAAGVADLFDVEGAVGGGGDGDEDEGERESGDKDGQKQGGGRDAESDVAEVEGGEAEDAEAEGEEETRVDFVGEESDHGHAADSA